MTKEEIYEKANSVIGIGGMTGNERLSASGLMTLFDKAKKNDKYLARTILQALKFDELSISRIIGYSIDALKYPNAWDFPNQNSNGIENGNNATLEYSNLNEIGMGAPLSGICKLKMNDSKVILISEKCGETCNLDKKWTENRNSDLGQILFWWNVSKNWTFRLGKTNAD